MLVHFVFLWQRFLQMPQVLWALGHVTLPHSVSTIATPNTTVMLNIIFLILVGLRTRDKTMLNLSATTFYEDRATRMPTQDNLVISTHRAFPRRGEAARKVEI